MISPWRIRTKHLPLRARDTAYAFVNEHYNQHRLIHSIVTAWWFPLPFVNITDYERDMHKGNQQRNVPFSNAQHPNIAWYPIRVRTLRSCLRVRAYLMRQEHSVQKAVVHIRAHVHEWMTLHVHPRHPFEFDRCCKTVQRTQTNIEQLQRLTLKRHPSLWVMSFSKRDIHSWFPVNNVPFDIIRDPYHCGHHERSLDTSLFINFLLCAFASARIRSAVSFTNLLHLSQSRVQLHTVDTPCNRQCYGTSSIHSMPCSTFRIMPWNCIASWYYMVKLPSLRRIVSDSRFFYVFNVRLSMDQTLNGTLGTVGHP